MVVPPATPRQEAEIAINRRFPLWGRVDGKAMEHEKPSAVEALEALKANKAQGRDVAFVQSALDWQA